MKLRAMQLPGWMQFQNLEVSIYLLCTVNTVHCYITDFSPLRMMFPHKGCGRFHKYYILVMLNIFFSYIESLLVIHLVNKYMFPKGQRVPVVGSFDGGGHGGHVDNGATVCHLNRGFRHPHMCLTWTSIFCSSCCKFSLDVVQNTVPKGFDGLKLFPIITVTVLVTSVDY